ncbi:MAG: mechanosensitive ion channel [Rhodocyclaceae bacterium]|nr:mechanosensitive ion channel [Rhodocyclaceae bacterium]MBX3669257.1 mechanosensitive ion channel [Rhodocyclaceae bacterium]
MSSWWLLVLCWLIAWAPGAGATVVAASEPQAVSAPVVRAGIRLRAILVPPDTKRSFELEFDLWLRYTGSFSSADLVFPDAAGPVDLGQALDSVDSGNDHYRLYRVRANLRYDMDDRDLVQGQRRLRIRFGPGPHVAWEGAFVPDYEGMGLSSAGTDGWLNQLRADGLLSGAEGWSLAEASLEGTTDVQPVLGNPRFPAGKRERPLVQAKLSLQAPSSFPPAAGLAGSLSGPALPAAALLGLSLSLGTGWAAQRRLAAAARIIVRLLAISAAFYFAQSLLVWCALYLLNPVALRQLLNLLRCIWWMLPAVWLHSVLPFIWDEVKRRTGHPIPSVTHLAVVFLAYVMMGTLAGYFVLGLSATAVGAMSGVMTVVLGVALQNVILDAFCGVMLSLEQPFKILHWINIGGQHQGQVIDMNWRTTRLLSRANNIICVPNSHIARNLVTNYSLPSPTSCVEFSLVLDEAVPVGVARKLMREGVQEAAERGRILSDPKPRVVLESSREHGVRYRVQFFVNMTLVSDTAALTDALEGTLARLDREGIRVASLRPQFTLPDGSSITAASRAGEAPPADVCANDGARTSATPPAAAATPITEAQIALVQESWAQVRPIGDSAAALFYQRLFELDPQLRHLFRGDPRAQQRKLIGMLSIMVRGLQALDDLIPTLQDLGLKHQSYKVEDRHYDTVGEALLWALQKGLGDAFTIDVKAAWVRAYTLLAETMKAAK